MNLFLYWTSFKGSDGKQQPVIGLMITEGFKSICWTDTLDGFAFLFEDKALPFKEQLLSIWSKWETRFRSLLTLQPAVFMVQFQQIATQFDNEFHGLLPPESKAKGEKK